MAIFKLQATPTTLFIDTQSGQTSATSMIAWEAPNVPTIWGKIGASDWKQVPITDPRAAFMSAQLSPGMTASYRLYHDQAIDPNYDPTGSRFEEAVVVALLAKPKSLDWARDLTDSVGGTYYAGFVSGGQTVTTVRLVISKKPPVQDAFGHWEFEIEQQDTSPNALSHKCEVYPLLAGNNYFCGWRISDTYGNWYWILKRLTTLRRVVTVNFSEVWPVDSGDNSGASEASFSFSICEGLNVATIHLLNNAKAKNGKPLPFPRTTTLGPKAVNSLSHDIGIHAFGRDDDGPFEPDEHASNYQDPNWLH